MQGCRYCRFASQLTKKRCFESDASLRKCAKANFSTERSVMLRDRSICIMSTHFNHLYSPRMDGRQYKQNSKKHKSNGSNNIYSQWHPYVVQINTIVTRYRLTLIHTMVSFKFGNKYVKTFTLNQLYTVQFNAK